MVLELNNLTEILKHLFQNAHALKFDRFEIPISSYSLKHHNHFKTISKLYKKK